MRKYKGQKKITLTKQSWKKRRTMDAPMRGSLATADLTTDFTVLKTLGHFLEQKLFES